VRLGDDPGVQGPLRRKSQKLFDDANDANSFPRLRLGMSRIKCSICLEQVRDVTHLACGHSFCNMKCINGGINRWLQMSGTCPLCRVAVFPRVCACPSDEHCYLCYGGTALPPLLEAPCFYFFLCCTMCVIVGLFIWMAILCVEARMGACLL